MTDLEKLIKTFDEIGVKYDLTTIGDDDVICICEDLYNNDFIFVNGKFDRFEVY